MLAVLALLLTGCATSASSAKRATDSSQQPLSRAEQAATTTCTALGPPASLTFNAQKDFDRGAIDATKRDSDLMNAAAEFRAVDASGSPAIAGALQRIVDHISAATPDSTGRPYDPDSREFVELRSSLGAACEAAGASLAVLGHGG